MAATLLRSGTYSGCFTSRITTVRRIQAVSLAPRVNTIQPCVIPSCSFLGGEQSVVVYLILITMLGAHIGVRHSVVEAAMQTAFAWLTALQALPHVEQFRISEKSECSCIFRLFGGVSRSLWLVVQAISAAHCSGSTQPGGGAPLSLLLMPRSLLVAQSRAPGGMTTNWHNAGALLHHLTAPLSEQPVATFATAWLAMSNCTASR